MRLPGLAVVTARLVGIAQCGCDVRHVHSLRRWHGVAPKVCSLIGLLCSAHEEAHLVTMPHVCQNYLRTTLHRECVQLLATQ